MRGHRIFDRCFGALCGVEYFVLFGGTDADCNGDWLCVFVVGGGAGGADLVQLVQRYGGGWVHDGDYADSSGGEYSDD